jgi:beta-galactosidase
MKIIIAQLFIIIPMTVFSQHTASREHLLMDFNWRFAYGHAYDASQDFETSTGYFSYFAKASYGDGAAAKDFDDRSWRKLDVPHDWAVELPFDSTASYSHGFKAIGRKFPNASVGWYRKHFSIPSNDLGRKISIAFDGVFRNCSVWVNGFYLGTEPSGYTSFEYSISDYINYGGENVIAVRVDATMEEGWFYEGAGIYRHVWINKTEKLHVATNGTFVTTKILSDKAYVTAQVSVINEATVPKSFTIQHAIIDADRKTVATGSIKNVTLKTFDEKNLSGELLVNKPILWSPGNPYLYTLITTLTNGNKEIDRYETVFGIRTIRFDANQGFFLNGKHFRIQGTNNHQDHAGVGTAMPDGLIDFRVRLLKSFGCNTFRCSHNPPTPELLNACDRLGMLVIDENRLMGVNSIHFDNIKKLLLRDRNHPSVIAWSIGNEEWGIEGNAIGARIATTLQAFTKSIDSTRAITAAISGGWREGISNVIDVMGVNYIGQINTDEQHQKFPDQPMMGTEEGSTYATRGIYVDDYKKHWIAAYDKKPNPRFYSIEEGWKYYVQRAYLAGMIIWTGFDYRGEPTPFTFPSVSSLFGMVDACGFPKDNFFYLKSWWTNQTTVHLFPHWNWKGREGEEIDVRVFSNCEEVELFLNKISLGRKSMELNGHLEWKVKYNPGTLEAVGLIKGKRVATDWVKTTDDPVSLKMSADTSVITANKEDVAIIAVDMTDKNDLHLPTANDEITFGITGPGKIIGVGNGCPTSLEADKYIETISSIKIEDMKEKAVDNMANRSETAATYDITGWKTAFIDDRDEAFGKANPFLVYRGLFTLPKNFKEASVNFLYNNIGKQQSIYINGKQIATGIDEKTMRSSFHLDTSILREGQNSIAIVATPLLKKQAWDKVNTDIGLFQLIFPAASWKRRLFNGWAQVIIQATGDPGEIILSAKATGIEPAKINIQSKAATQRPSVAGSY